MRDLYEVRTVHMSGPATFFALTFASSEEEAITLVGGIHRQEGEYAPWYPYHEAQPASRWRREWLRTGLRACRRCKFDKVAWRCHLVGAAAPTLANTTPPDRDPLRALGLIPGANLAGVDLAGADLAGAVLRGANLRGTILECCDLRGADLSGADLTGANFGCANLEGADLTGANLEGAYLEGANLRGAILEGANLASAVLEGTCLDPEVCDDADEA